MAYKLIEAMYTRRRAVNASQLIALICAGARVEKRKLAPNDATAEKAA